MNPIIKICLLSTWIFSTEVETDPCNYLPSPCTYSFINSWHMVQSPESAPQFNGVKYDFIVPGLYIFEQIAWVELAIDSLNENQSWEVKTVELIFFVDDCKINPPLITRAESLSGLYIPNVFSPNNDGINDLFDVYGAEIENCKIFDRWGNMVYEGSRPWNGGESENGTYVYLITMLLNGDRLVTRGEVNILR